MDYPDPNESCLLIYLAGCSHNCEGCHNKDLQNINKGNEFSALNVYKELNFMSIDYKTNNIVFQGGDPLFSTNLDFIKDFIALNKTHKYNICIYTGYSISLVKSNFNKGEVDFWKCGLYDKTTHRESMKTDKEFILSSSNQEFYDSKFRKISKQGILRF